MVGNVAQVLIGEGHGPHHAVEGQDEAAAADPDQESGHDLGPGTLGDVDAETGAFAGLRVDLDATAGTFNGPTDDIQAHAPAADVTDLGRGRDAAGENEIDDVVAGQGCPGGHQAGLDGLGLDTGKVQAAAVIFDREPHAGLGLGNGHPDGALGRFAGGRAGSRRFDAVIGGIADQVNNRRIQEFENGFIEGQAFARQNHGDVLAPGGGDITN